jgi:hypothetical protein
VNSTIGQVVEKEIAIRTKEILMHSQNKLQFGFTKNCSAETCALVITEAIAEAKHLNTPIFAVMLDAKKAFDMVWQHSTLLAMHEQGVTDGLWDLYADMYKTVTSQICIKGELSCIITEKHGIRQGGETSSEVFKCRGNPLLQNINEQPLAQRIGSIHIGAPITADDTCILSQSRIGAQSAIKLAECDANMELYEFSSTKPKAVMINSRLTPEEAATSIPLTLNGQQIEY